MFKLNQKLQIIDIDKYNIYNVFFSFLVIDLVLLYIFNLVLHYF